jgi:hypothetical protein
MTFDLTTAPDDTSTPSPPVMRIPAPQAPPKISPVGGGTLAGPADSGDLFLETTTPSTDPRFVDYYAQAYCADDGSSYVDPDCRAQVLGALTRADAEDAAPTPTSIGSQKNLAVPAAAATAGDRLFKVLLGLIANGSSVGLGVKLQFGVAGDASGTVYGLGFNGKVKVGISLDFLARERADFTGVPGGVATVKKAIADWWNNGNPLAGPFIFPGGTGIQFQFQIRIGIYAQYEAKAGLKTDNPIAGITFVGGFSGSINPFFEIQPVVTVNAVALGGIKPAANAPANAQLVGALQLAAKDPGVMPQVAQSLPDLATTNNPTAKDLVSGQKERDLAIAAGKKTIVYQAAAAISQKRADAALNAAATALGNRIKAKWDQSVDDGLKEQNITDTIAKAQSLIDKGL